MARARNIKPGLYKNEDLAECSIWARFLFPGLWMLADREGRLEDRPKRIKGELLPFDSQDVEPLLRELEAHKFLVRYQIDGVSYIQISKFKDHQAPHYSEKESVIKPPSFPEIDVHMSAKDSRKEMVIKTASQPPDSLIPDSLVLIPESTPALEKREKSNGKARKRSMPNGFEISDRVRTWAEKKGFGMLDRHFESFVRKCRAKDYQYVDWDEGFMGAISDDWAKLNGAKVLDYSAVIATLEDGV